MTAHLHAVPTVERPEWMHAIRSTMQTYPEIRGFLDWLIEVEGLRPHDLLDVLERPDKWWRELDQFRREPDPFGPASYGGSD